MGDRGGTATTTPLPMSRINYTRWEIGGEPQRGAQGVQGPPDYTRWEIGGEPQRAVREL